jgi:hypothetical protein
MSLKNIKKKKKVETRRWGGGLLGMGIDSNHVDLFPVIVIKSMGYQKQSISSKLLPVNAVFMLGNTNCREQNISVQ